MSLLNRSLLNSETVEDAVVAEPPLFMTWGVRAAPDAALLCLDHRRVFKSRKKAQIKKPGSRSRLLKPHKHQG